MDKNIFKINEDNLDFKIQGMDYELKRMEEEMDILSLEYDYDMLKEVKSRYDKLLIELHRLISKIFT